MIQGVNQQNRLSTYQSAAKKVPSVKDDNAPAFLLGNEEEGVIWERAKEEKKEGAKKSDGLGKEGGQKRNPSSLVKEKDIDTEQPPSGRAEAVRGISDVFQKVSLTMKKIFTKLAEFFWYGSEKEADLRAENMESPEAGSLTGQSAEEVMESGQVQEASGEGADAGKEEEASEDAQQAEEIRQRLKDEEIRKLLKEKNTEGVMEVLTDHHSRHLAKNSSLLTRYDRKGSLTEPDNSNQIRILYQDKAIKM